MDVPSVKEIQAAFIISLSKIRSLFKGKFPNLEYRRQYSYMCCSFEFLSQILNPDQEFREESSIRILVGRRISPIATFHELHRVEKPSEPSFVHLPLLWIWRSESFDCYESPSLRIR
jgi:hypothetical protein